MNETYVECMVARKPSALMKFLKILFIMLAVAFAILAFMALGLIGLILAAVFGVLAYVVSIRTDIEYEYLYVDKEISIDRIMGKSKRKHVATYETDRMEIFAPLNSYHLDDYKNRQTQNKDFSSGIESQPEKRYALYYEGNIKVILEPNEDFVKAVAGVAPRKVFKD